MMIGDKMVTWKHQEPLFFDDSYEHAVWNDSSENRVVLLFDLWHPHLTQAEIAAIQDMFDYASEQGYGSSPSSSSNITGNVH